MSYSSSQSASADNSDVQLMYLFLCLLFFVYDFFTLIFLLPVKQQRRVYFYPRDAVLALY